MRRRRHGRFRRLQFRLLFWFLGAIVLAVVVSAVTGLVTDDGASETPTRVVSRHVQHRLARLWDDPRATDAYVAELRETTGLDLRLRRDPPFSSLRHARAGGIVFEGGVAYWPVVRDDVVVGALELRSGSPAPRGWRIAVALGAALVVLGIAARRVSMRLARPLEHLADTAERFGAGDLSARTGIERLPGRWVAEEVRHVGRAFDGMAARIERVVIEQRELLAAISHELRSPLGRARIALEIARDRNPSEGRSLGDVDRELVEVDAILGDLLASARAGLADLRLETVAVVPWLRDRAAAETNPIEIVADAAAEKAEVAIDGALLGRALHNLFANAWAHGHAKDASLGVTVTVTGGRIRVAVSDRGPGFPSDLLPRVFEPFVTGTGSARSPGVHGIGLGLALVRRIVEAHHGTVSARNREEKQRILGAEVAFELPAPLRSPA